MSELPDKLTREVWEGNDPTKPESMFQALARQEPRPPGGSPQTPVVIEPETAQPSKRKVVPWGIREIFIACVLFLVMMLGAATLDLAIVLRSLGLKFSDVPSLTSGSDASLPTGFAIRSMFYQNLFALVACALPLASLGWAAFSLLGLTTINWRWRALLGLLFGGFLFVLGITVGLCSVLLLKHSGISGPELDKLTAQGSQKVVEKLLRQPAYIVALTTLAVAVVAPIGEEIFFRGFVYQGLKSHMPVWAAAIVSSAFFGAVHFNLVHFMALFVLGLALVWIFERTGSLTAPIVAHGVNNAVATMVFMYEQGMIGR